MRSPRNPNRTISGAPGDHEGRRVLLGTIPSQRNLHRAVDWGDITSRHQILWCHEHDSYPGRVRILGCRSSARMAELQNVRYLVGMSKAVRVVRFTINLHEN